MPPVIAKRMAAEIDDEVIVFLIGMRVNKWWKIHKWLPVALAMPRMLKELNRHPELGCLGGRSWLGNPLIIVQYWRSFADLERFAKNRDSPHLPEWQAFNKAVGTSGDVGVWHETYRVRPGDYESVYVNMPPFGLGRAGRLVPATGSKTSAAGRMRPKV